MLRDAIFIVFALVGCHAETPVPSQGVYCGHMPENIHLCLSIPSLVRADATKCQNVEPPCAKYTCLFTQSGWLKDYKVDKNKVSDHFTKFAVDHTSWAPAVNHMKAACLGDKNLPAQGVYINCPAYDTLHCALTSFIRNSQSQWKQTPECQQARDYASSCPVCPEQCFTAQVPNDSCHACYSLPRSA